MNDEEKAKMKKLEDDLAKALADNTEKDRIIEMKNQDIVGARKQYKKLADMTDEEKSKLTAKEIELQERQEAHEADVAKFKKEQDDRTAKEIESRRGELATKFVGTKNPELRTKILENFGMIKDSEKAQTPEEVQKFMKIAFDMLGEAKPSAVNQAIIDTDGGMAPDDTSGGENFANTEAGKGLEKMMGIEEPVADTAK